MLYRFRAAAFAIALAAIGLGWSPVTAQEFPTRPVVIVVPQPPGGGTDIISRIFGNKLSI